MPASPWSEARPPQELQQSAPGCVAPAAPFFKAAAVTQAGSATIQKNLN